MDTPTIIPLADLGVLSADREFWDAQDATNTALRPQGLYITHLFRADQVFLRREAFERANPRVRELVAKGGLEN